MTNEFKQRVVEEVMEQGANYPSDARQATALGINAAQLSRIKKGELNRVLSDAKWITIARKLGVEMNPKAKWVTAKTQVFDFIYSQLDACQSRSLSALLCDIPDIGKTHTAKAYARKANNVVYIDCSQTKTKQALVRKIAQEFGVGHTGKYAEVYEDLVYCINTINKPLIILDEVGDLHYPAFLEIKGMWNATERACGWYMMGADGLKRKIEGNRSRQKVGYAELFSRFGNRFQKIVPEGKTATENFLKEEMAMVAKANGNRLAVNKMFHKTKGSLRRVYIEINKPKAVPAASN